jgi:hypothetical protein
MEKHGRKTEMQRHMRRDTGRDAGADGEFKRVGVLNQERRRKETATPDGPAFHRRLERLKDLDEDVRRRQTTNRTTMKRTITTTTTTTTAAFRRSFSSLTAHRGPICVVH